MRLPVQRQVIGILGDQHLCDQRLGRDAALDDPRRCRGLHDRAFARTAAVARPARDQHAEGGGHDVEPFGNVLANLMERAAAAGARLLIDIDDLLDPFEMRGQRTTVGLARTVRRRSACLGAGFLGGGERRFDFLQGKLELIGIELFGTATEPVALKGLDDRLQARDLGMEGLHRIELAGLFEDKRAQHIDVIGKVRLGQHGSSESAEQSPVNRQSAAPEADARHAPGASPALPAKRQIALPSAASRHPGCPAT